MKIKSKLSGLALVPAALVFAAGPLLAAAPTFYRDVLPILQKHCQSCHRPGEIGPMPLMTYAQARPWAKAIRETVLRRKMPPWFAAKAPVHFENDPSLSAGEIRVIDEWASGGAVAGSERDAPSPREWPEGWNIAGPDVVVETQKPFSVPARGEVAYQSIIIPLNLKRDTWVSAAEIRPSARAVVHHIVAYVREPGSDWLRDKPVGEYFPHPGVTKSDILAIYTPGQGPTTLPQGMAKLIPAGSDLVLQFHYTPNGKAVQSSVKTGLVVATGSPRYRVLTLQMGTTRFRIPPYEANHRVAVSGTLPGDALLLSMFPHMHLRGKAFDYEIVGAGGRVETLLRVAPYDFYWQLNYRLKEPRLLKKDTLLRFTGWFDNSANNALNPDPSAEVTYGEQSWEEMMVGFFDVAVEPGVDKERYFRLR